MHSSSVSNTAILNFKTLKMYRALNYHYVQIRVNVNRKYYETCGKIFTIPIVQENNVYKKKMFIYTFIQSNYIKSYSVCSVWL